MRLCMRKRYPCACCPAAECCAGIAHRWQSTETVLFAKDKTKENFRLLYNTKGRPGGCW